MFSPGEEWRRLLLAGIGGRKRLHQAVGEADILHRDIAPHAEQNRAQPVARIFNLSHSGFQPPDTFLLPRLDHGIEQMKLGREIRIEAADAGPGALGNVEQSRAMVSAIGKRIPGSIQDCVADGFFLDLNQGAVRESCCRSLALNRYRHRRMNAIAVHKRDAFAPDPERAVLPRNMVNLPTGVNALAVALDFGAEER